MKDKRTILIVDDQPSACETLEGFLIKQDYDLAFAGDGAEALEKVAELRPDLILLDIMMPGLDGFEVCQRLKAEERWRHIPVILITALDSKQDLARGLDAGADDFLSKPVSSLELRARVRSMLRIKKQHDELEEQYQQLEATLQLREDLASMIVHDMRTPLASILGFTELLLVRGTAAAEDLKDVQIIHGQTNRLNAFANDLLMLAKMEQGQLILNRSAVDINQLVQGLEESHAVIARSRKIDLIIDLPPEPRQISLDANLFQRVLDNLLSNALKFSPAGSKVTLRVEDLGPKTVSSSPGSGVLVKVLDEGPGIAPEDQERIFDKFQIAGLKRKGVSQVGLGLAFCKLVVEAHGGRIFVDDNQPRGSVFTVEI